MLIPSLIPIVTNKHALQWWHWHLYIVHHATALPWSGQHDDSNKNDRHLFGYSVGPKGPKGDEWSGTANTGTLRKPERGLSSTAATGKKRLPTTKTRSQPGTPKASGGSNLNSIMELPGRSVQLAKKERTRRVWSGIS